MSEREQRRVDWIGSAYKDFRAFPDEVQDHMGYALHLAQTGDKHEDAKPLKGFGGASVLEIVSDHVGDTYRAVYTVKFATSMCCTRSRRSRRRAARRRQSTWN
jgi:phage-related protein